MRDGPIERERAISMLQNIPVKNQSSVPPSNRGVMTRRGLIGGGLILGSGFVSACEALGMAWRYRYRLTGEVVHNGSAYHGSSVIEVLRSKGYDSVDAKIRGEAVAIDIPVLGTLFLLLYSDTSVGSAWPWMMPHHAFSDRLGGAGMTDPGRLARLSAMQGETAVLTPDLYPMLVRFRDIKAPKSVEQVRSDASPLSDSLGISIKAITVEITNDAITQEIRQRLPWLGTSIKYALDGSLIGGGPALSNLLTAMAFERKDYG